MTVKLPHYQVLIADPAHPDDPTHGTEHEVYIVHGDQLRAELEGPRNGIPNMAEAPMHGITLWLWAALMRTHVIDQAFQEFRTRLLGFEEIQEGPGDAAVGPTPPSPLDGSPYSSLASSVTSTGGSTQTRTPV